MKGVVIHLISAIIGCGIWVFFYINGTESFEINLKLNLKLPKDFIIAGSKKDFYIKILVETNRRFKNSVKNNIYEVSKELSLKGKIFPKKNMFFIYKN